MTSISFSQSISDSTKKPVQIKPYSNSIGNTTFNKIETLKIIKVLKDYPLVLEQLSNSEKTIEDYKKLIKDLNEKDHNKDAIINTLNSVIHDKDGLIINKNSEIDNKNTQIDVLNKTVAALNKEVKKQKLLKYIGIGVAIIAPITVKMYVK